MIVTILYRIKIIPECKSSLFNDVPANDYYVLVVAQVSENKNVTGKGNGLFGPNDSIIRERMGGHSS